HRRLRGNPSEPRLEGSGGEGKLRPGERAPDGGPAEGLLGHERAVVEANIGDLELGEEGVGRASDRLVRRDEGTLFVAEQAVLVRNAEEIEEPGEERPAPLDVEDEEEGRRDLLPEIAGRREDAGARVGSEPQESRLAESPPGTDLPRDE